ncbi:hypothetical protein [Nocardiopsis sp. NPDC055824]
MSDFYYSDRNGPPIAQDRESITPEAWTGVVSVVDRALNDGSLAHAFPVRDCHNHHGAGDGPITGVNRKMLFSAVRAHIPRLSLTRMTSRFDPNHVPATSDALDLIEFIGPRIHRPDRQSGCTWNGEDVHYNFAKFRPLDPDDLMFDDHPRRPPGQEDFREAIEMIFRRQGLAFTLDEGMKVRRLGPPEARPALSDFRPQTGDPILDGLFVEATTRFLSPDPQERNRALDVLWKAFERTKTLHHPEKKNVSADKLLKEATGGSEKLFQLLKQEFKALTDIGNQFRIRHQEHDTHELPSSEFVDYLFTRMLSVMAFVLRASGRMAS